MIGKSRSAPLVCLLLVGLAPVGCGHAAIHARTLPQPVLIGPTRHLPPEGRGPSPTGPEPSAEQSGSTDGAARSGHDGPRPIAPEKVRDEEGRFEFTAWRKTQSVAVGTGTSTTEIWAIPGAFEAALLQRSRGEPTVVHHVQSIDCRSWFVFPLVVADVTAECTLTVTTTEPARTSEGSEGSSAAPSGK